MKFFTVWRRAGVCVFVGLAFLYLRTVRSLFGLSFMLLLTGRGWTPCCSLVFEIPPLKSLNQVSVKSLFYFLSFISFWQYNKIQEQDFEQKWRMSKLCFTLKSQFRSRKFFACSSSAVTKILTFYSAQNTVKSFISPIITNNNLICYL